MNFFSCNRLGPASLAGLLLLLLLLWGCTSAPSPMPRTGGPASPAPAAGSPEASKAAQAWEIPASELNTQRLMRLQYDGPEGKGNLKVTLRLAAPERYQITLADTLGRSLWSLDVGPSIPSGGAKTSGSWIDYRNEIWCPFEGSLELAGVPLAPFPLPSLPALLLGRLPVLPSGKITLGEGSLAYPAGKKGRLTAKLGGGGNVESWTLWRGGEPRVWWRRAGDESWLSSRRTEGRDAGSGPVQMHWREVLREPLAGELQGPEPPSSFSRRCPS